MTGYLPDIPRLYTALAEWLACIIFMQPLRKRFGKTRYYMALLAAGLLQGGLQWLAGGLPLSFWVPGMCLNILLMTAFIYCCCDLKLKDAVYWCASAFVMAEFAASLEWQIYSFLIWKGLPHRPATGLVFMVFFYGAVFSIAFLLKRKIVSWDTGTGVSAKEMISAGVVAVIAFVMSNIGFVLEGAFYGRDAGMILFYVRTLVDLSGICILYIQQNQRHEAYLRKELQSIHNMFELQYEQYRAYKENSEYINRKCHDLKHQIEVLRSERDEEKRVEYLREMEDMVRNFKSDVVTGNGVLDTILTRKNAYCIAHQIPFTCIADGKLLKFMEPLDICSIFGNALDNAIESVEKNVNPDKRMIRLKVFSQNSFLMICLENYCEETRDLDHGFPDTTKKDKLNHGYGLKSIRHTVQKYGGTMTLHSDNNWFIMRVLIPVA